MDSNVSYLLKQAAVRSLSCEVVPKKEGKIYFGDSVQGHVLSTTFFVKDSQARGFHRWYSIIVFMRDKHFLLNSWVFFQRHINQIILKLQQRASEVYSREQNICSQRALRLSSIEQKHSVARSLAKLTGSYNVFAQLHSWFTWLLSTAPKRLEELMPTRLLDFDKTEDTAMAEGETVSFLRHLRQLLGEYNFQRFLYSTLIGRQIIVRGPKFIVDRIITILRLFLPTDKCRCEEFSETYKAPELCNIIGLDLCAAVPVSSDNIMRLDILPSTHTENNTSPMNLKGIFENYCFILKNDSDLPEKLPTLLAKLDRALSDKSLSDRVVWLQLKSVLDKWIHLAEIIRARKKQQNKFCTSTLFRCIGVQEQDEKLIEFWTS